MIRFRALLFFCELLALGLVAASIYLKYPKDLARPDMPGIALDRFPTLLEKAAFIAVHTRAPVDGAVDAGPGDSGRGVSGAPEACARSRIVAYAPIAVLLVIGLHAAAQGWLQKRGDLVFEFRDDSPGHRETVREMPLTMPATSGGAVVGPSGSASTEPASVMVEVRSIRRLIVKEDQNSQWLALFGGDLLFAVPVLFAWVLSFRTVPLLPEGQR